MRVYTASPGRYTNTGRRAVFLSPYSSLCSSWLLAGPDARHHGRYGSEGLLHARRRSWQWHVQVWFCWFACRCPSRCASIGSQALNAPHYGRYGPEGQLFRSVLDRALFLVGILRRVGLRLRGGWCSQC